MNIKELKEIIKDLPDNAMVYVEGDHGQSSEQAGYILFSDDKELPYYGDDMEWFETGEEKNDNITSILIT